MIMLPPTSCPVDCAGRSHRLSWQAGTLVAVDHPDAEREQALTALGGERYRCLELLSVWNRHVEDLDVLLLASRGAQDRFIVNRPSNGWRPLRPAVPGISYSGSYVPLGQQHHHHHAQPAEAELRDVLALGGHLPDRLVATVATAWADRLDESETRPRLVAALYGRFVATLQEWLGEPDLQLDFTMTDSRPVLYRTADGIRAEVPFSWLLEVWSPGLAVVADRFVLAARTGVGSVELETVGRGLDDRSTLTIAGL